MGNKELNKQTGVNYDYILGLKKYGNRVFVEEYPILRHEYEIDNAFQLLNDDEADINDVYNAIRNCLPNETYDFCFGHEYNDNHIGDMIPVYQLYFELKNDLKKRISSEFKRREKNLPETERSNWFRIIEIEQEIKKDLKWLIKRQKEEFLKKAIPSVYAYDYDTTLKENDIKEGCIVFSNDKHGDKRKFGKPRGYHVTHKINEEISVRIETNFCYGSASYFHVVVTYRGIELIPYSIWIRYYYAGYLDLMGCTRSFERKREKWHDCMNFIEFFINSAIDNPEDFIKNQVIFEVKGLINGLEKIFSFSEEKMKAEMKIKERDGDEKYIGIHGANYANERDEELYYISPKEVTMVYRMEKISGALRFLESLNQISEIYPKVKKVENRIIELNQLIFPELNIAISSFNTEIKSLSGQLIPLQKEMEKYENSYNKMKSYLDKKISHVVLVKELDKIIVEFKNTHPLYYEYEKKIENLKPKINSLIDKKYKREQTLKKLIGFKDLIVKYAYK